MKKMIMFVLLMLIPLSLFSLSIDGEMGWTSSPFGDISTSTGNEDTPYNVYTSVDVSIPFFQVFWMQGSIACQMYQEEKVGTGSWTLTPTFLNYSFSTGLQLEVFKIGWEHSCTHPQFVYSHVINPEEVYKEGSLDRVFISFFTEDYNQREKPSIDDGYELEFLFEAGKVRGGYVDYDLVASTQTAHILNNAYAHLGIKLWLVNVLYFEELFTVQFEQPLSAHSSIYFSDFRWEGGLQLQSFNIFIARILTLPRSEEDYSYRIKNLWGGSASGVTQIGIKYTY